MIKNVIRPTELITSVCIALITSFCFALPTEHVINGETFKTIDPDGFVNVTAYRQLQKKVHDDNPKIPELLDIYVSKEDALEIASRDSFVDVFRQIRVCVSRKFKSRTMSQKDFDEFKKIIRKQYTSNAFNTVTKSVNVKKSKTVSEELQSNVEFTTLGTLQLGVDYEDENIISWSTIRKDKIATKEGEREIKIATTGAMVVIKGKLFNIYSESVFNDENDLLWCQNMAVSYAKKILLANSNSPTFQDSRTLPVTKFQKDDVLFFYPNIFTLKEIPDLNSHVVLLEATDSNSIVIDIAPKVLDLERESQDVLRRIKETYIKNGMTSSLDIQQCTPLEMAGLSWRSFKLSFPCGKIQWHCDMYVSQNNWKTLTIMCQYSADNKSKALDRFSRIKETLKIRINTVESDLINSKSLAKALYVSITIADAKRTNLGLDSLWPSSTISSKKSQDIADLVFETSSLFFNCLLDMTAYKTVKWSPYVRNIETPVISGSLCSSNAVIRSFNKDNNMWIVVANLEDGDSDNMPVLISRNVDVTELEKSINRGMTEADLATNIKLGNLCQTPFGNQGAIVVLKGGTIKIITPEKSTFRDIVYYPVELDRNKIRKPIRFLLP